MLRLIRAGELAFYLAGIPKDMISYVSKKILLSNSKAIYCGVRKKKKIDKILEKKELLNLIKKDFYYIDF